MPRNFREKTPRACEREMLCTRESILYCRRTPRVCRDVELAGVFWFRRDFPPGSGGDGEVGGISRRRRFEREACACRTLRNLEHPRRPASLPLCETGYENGAVALSSEGTNE